MNDIHESQTNRRLTRRSYSRVAGIAALIPALTLLLGCETNSAVRGDRHPDVSWADAPAAVDVDVRTLEMFNGRTGERMTWDDLLYVFDEVDVILVGEQHGHPVGLATADAMWADLLNRSSSAVLSMEFFERDEQIALDDYLNGVTDKATFLKAAGRSPGNYPPGHRVMIEASKDARRPVIASNIPRRYAALVRKDGFDAIANLSAEQRRLIELPDAVPTEGRYRDDFFEVMRPMMEAHGVHSPTEAAPQGEAAKETITEEEAAENRKQEIESQISDMFRAQYTKDVTMADSILEGIYHGHRPVLHVVGQFHTDYEGGIPTILRQQDPNLFVWTVSVVDERSEELREEDRNRADCVIYVGPRDGME